MDLKEYADSIAWIATILFMIQMLTPLATFYRVTRTSTVGDLAVAPYNTAYLSCGVWMLYGIVIHDSYVTNTNLYGAALQLGYTICYYLYCQNRLYVGKQLSITTLMFLAASFYCYIETDHAVLLQRMAFICTVVTFAFFVAPFANLAKVLKEKNAESLPLVLISFTFGVSFFWMLYGYAINDLALLLTNLIGVIFSNIQLFLIAWYRKPTHKGKLLLPLINN